MITQKTQSLKIKLAQIAQITRNATAQPSAVVREGASQGQSATKAKSKHSTTVTMDSSVFRVAVQVMCAHRLFSVLKPARET